MKKLSVIFICCLFGAACGEPVEPTDDGNPTKEELAAQGKSDGGFDWCERLGWYGDGICDTFCQNPDPDCDGEIDCTVAFVVPYCEAGYRLVDELTCDAGGDLCETSEQCGIVSNCLFVGEFCPQVVGTPAACNLGFREVETCETADCVIERGSGDKCTDLAFCEPEIDCNTLVPTCESDEREVDALTCGVAGDASCRTIDACGVSTHCLFIGEFCPQVVGTPAGCPGGTIEVNACQSEDCQIVRGTGDQCTDIAFCEPAVQCLAIPTCNSDEISVSSQACANSGTCRDVTMCGETIHCWDYPKFCAQVVGTPPACLGNETQTTGCSTAELNSGTCVIRSGTGDKCANHIYCRED